MKSHPGNAATQQTDVRLEFERAANAHKRGELVSAEAAYRHLLEHAPGHGDALNLLGILLHQTERSQEAIELLSILVCE